MGNEVSSNAASTHTHAIATRTGDVQDWHGETLRKGVLKVLGVGDVVRVNVQSLKDGKDVDGGAPYFEIVKIKHGTFWGRAENTYGTLHWMRSLDEGTIFPFRATNIIEVPITWQSKKQQKRMVPFRTGHGRCITGMTHGR